MLSKEDKRSYYDNTINYNVTSKTKNVQNIIDVF